MARRRIGADLRALAALRIALGSLLLLDLALRSRNVEAFLTDRGVLPVAGFERYYPNDPSLHAASGEPGLQWLLFLVAAVFAILLIVGYRTRTVTFVSWVLLVSLHGRNPLVLNGGDTLFRMLLLWGTFVPLEARWSVDARRTEVERTTVASVATLALLLQVVLVYVVNAAHKLNSEAWRSGEAAVTVLQLDQFTVWLGPILAEYPAVLRALTYAWLVLVTVSPLLLVLRGWDRALLASLFAGMHLGMLASMQIGIFPLVSVAALLPFYPPVVWDALEDAVGDVRPLGRANTVLDGLAATLPNPRLSSALAGATGLRLPSARPVVSTILPWILIVLVVTSNADAVGLVETPEPADETLELLEADQGWQMFAPNPLSTAYWYVAPAERSDGREVDALDGQALDFDRPPNVADDIPGARWRKYLSNVRRHHETDFPEYLGRYLCGRWNRTHDTDLTRVRIVVVQQDVAPYGEREPPTRRELGVYDCGSGMPG